MCIFSVAGRKYFVLLYILLLLVCHSKTVFPLELDRMEPGLVAPRAFSGNKHCSPSFILPGSLK